MKKSHATIAPDSVNKILTHVEIQMKAHQHARQGFPDGRYDSQAESPPNSPENPDQGDFCITQIVSRYNEVADGVLRYLFNRRCVDDNIEDPGNNPGEFSLTRNEGRDIVRTMSEDWVCKDSFCNVGLEDQRECFTCSDMVMGSDDLSSSE